MGLTNSAFGMYGGIILISVPQLLSTRHVPETDIAAMTAVMVSPGFWAFLVRPVLDVRVSRPSALVLFVDGWGYAKQGIAGSFTADASLGVIASALLGALLIWVASRRHRAPGALSP